MYGFRGLSNIIYKKYFIIKADWEKLKNLKHFFIEKCSNFKMDRQN